jgi:low affinity Fe/Cu permease
MQSLLERLQDFYIIDQPTVMLIAVFCSWAAYFVRSKLANVAFLLFLYPLFVFVAVTVMCWALHLEVISIRKASEWLMYSVTASAIGAMTGISLVAIYRQLVDFLTMKSHIRASIRRDEEDAAKGYERMHL